MFGAHHAARHHWHHYSRPSRLFWFALGSGTTYWYLNSRERTNNNHWGHCFRARVQAPPSLQSPSAVDTSLMPLQPSDGANYGPRENIMNARQRMDKDWEEEKLRMMAFTHKAGDKVADISEATLDSILSAVEGLKVKLADHRKQAEEAQQKLQEMEQAQVEATTPKSSRFSFKF